LISEPTVDYPRKLIVVASTGTGDINGGLRAMLCKELKKQKRERE
jgi:hypothetical protein